MDVEVDQSCKVEETGDTVLAFSDGLDYVIIIPDKVKKAAFRLLQVERRKTRKVATIWLFAVCLYLLLRDYLGVIEHVTIDVEYAGRDSDIKGILLMLIHYEYPAFTKDRISFALVGKKSRAHAKAWTVHKDKSKADKKITRAELLDLLS